MAHTDIILEGTNQQKAIQLMDLLNNRQLTPEQLDKLIPHTKEFLQELTTVIKRQTEIDKSNFDKIIDSSLQIIDNLCHSMNESPTESERLTFLSTIERIHSRMIEVQINEKKENRKTKSIFAILGSILLALICILSAGYFRNEKDQSS